MGEKGIKLTKDLKDKTARIYSIVCFFDGKQLKEFVGETNGKITDKKKGKHGYFFDFIFIPESQNKVLGEFMIRRDGNFGKSHIKKFARWYRN